MDNRFLCQYVMTIGEAEDPIEKHTIYIDVTMFAAASSEDAYAAAKSMVDSNGELYRENGFLMKVTCHGIRNISAYDNYWDEADSFTRKNTGVTITDITLKSGVVTPMDLVQPESEFDIFNT